MKTIIKRILLCVLALPALLILGIAWVLWGGISNPAGRECIGQIRPPRGFERVAVAKDSFGGFIREFPLQKRGSHMRYYNGNLALGQYIGYAVLDLPMLANTEQCADAVMRMRAEYLWSKEKYPLIHFHSVSGKDQKYTGGANRNAFEKYLRNVYGNSNTSSLFREMKPKPFEEIVPGDVLVYEAPDSQSYGHAVLVADVAYNEKTGETAILLAQSSMPALTMHIIRDVLHPINSPWVIVDNDDVGIFVSGIQFYKFDLREW